MQPLGCAKMRGQQITRQHQRQIAEIAGAGIQRLGQVEQEDIARLYGTVPLTPLAAGRAVLINLDDAMVQPVARDQRRFALKVLPDAGRIHQQHGAEMTGRQRCGKGRRARLDLPFHVENDGDTLLPDRIAVLCWKIAQIEAGDRDGGRRPFWFTLHVIAPLVHVFFHGWRRTVGSCAFELAPRGRNTAASRELCGHSGKKSWTQRTNQRLDFIYDASLDAILAFEPVE